MADVFYNRTGGSFGGVEFEDGEPAGSYITKYGYRIIIPKGYTVDITAAEVELGTYELSSFTGYITAHIYSNNAASSPDEPNESIYEADNTIVLSGNNDRLYRKFDFSDVELEAGIYWFILEFSATGSGYIQYTGQIEEDTIYSDYDALEQAAYTACYKEGPYDEWTIVADYAYLYFALVGIATVSTPPKAINPFPKHKEHQLGLFDIEEFSWEIPEE